MTPIPLQATRHPTALTLSYSTDLPHMQANTRGNTARARGGRGGGKGGGRQVKYVNPLTASVGHTLSRQYIVIKLQNTHPYVSKNHGCLGVLWTPEIAQSGQIRSCSGRVYSTRTRLFFSFAFLGGNHPLLTPHPVANMLQCIIHHFGRSGSGAMRANGKIYDSRWGARGLRQCSVPNCLSAVDRGRETDWFVETRISTRPKKTEERGEGGGGRGWGKV